MAGMSGSSPLSRVTVALLVSSLGGVSSCDTKDSDPFETGGRTSGGQGTVSGAGGLPGGAGAGGAPMAGAGSGNVAGGGSAGSGMAGAAIGGAAGSGGGAGSGGSAGSGGCDLGCERSNLGMGQCDAGEVTWRCESSADLSEFLSNCEVLSTTIARFCCPESFVPACTTTDG